MNLNHFKVNIMKQHIQAKIAQPFSHIMLTTFLCATLFLFQACSSSKSSPSTKESHVKNPIFGVKGKKNDSDPLKIGSYPTLPAKPKTLQSSTPNANSKKKAAKNMTTHKPYHAPRIKTRPTDNPKNLPTPIIGKIYVQEDKRKAFDLKPTKIHTKETPKRARKPLLQATPTPQDVSDWLVLMGPGGSALTVWALAQGNWIWGYSLIDSIGFGWARLWRFHLFQNDQVMIENGETNTCLNGYKNGVIHMACNPKNRYQRFELIPMSNGAVQIKNVGLNTCIEIPIGDIFGDFHKVNGVFLSRCATGSNLTQQFYIAPPTFLEKPLYRR